MLVEAVVEALVVLVMSVTVVVEVTVVVASGDTQRVVCAYCYGDSALKL